MLGDMPETHVTQMTVDEPREALPGILDRVSKPRHRIAVVQDGEVVAAVVPADDLRKLDQYDREWDEGTEAIRAFSQAFADVPADKLEAEIGRIIAEGREGSAGRRPSGVADNVPETGPVSSRIVIENDSDNFRDARSTDDQ